MWIYSQRRGILCLNPEGCKECFPLQEIEDVYTLLINSPYPYLDNLVKAQVVRKRKYYEIYVNTWSDVKFYGTLEQAKYVAILKVLEYINTQLETLQDCYKILEKMYVKPLG